MLFVDGSSSGGVVVQSAHGPANWTTGLAKVGVMTLKSSSELTLVDGLGVDRHSILLLGESLSMGVLRLGSRGDGVSLQAILLRKLFVGMNLCNALVR